MEDQGSHLLTIKHWTSNLISQAANCYRLAITIFLMLSRIKISTCKFLSAGVLKIYQRLFIPNCTWNIMTTYIKFRMALKLINAICEIFFPLPGGFHGFRRSHSTITSHGEGLDNDQLDGNIAIIMTPDIPYQSWRTVTRAASLTNIHHSKKWKKSWRTTLQLRHKKGKTHSDTSKLQGS